MQIRDGDRADIIRQTDATQWRALELGSRGSRLRELLAREFLLYLIRPGSVLSTRI